MSPSALQEAERIANMLGQVWGEVIIIYHCFFAEACHLLHNIVIGM